MCTRARARVCVYTVACAPYCFRRRNNVRAPARSDKRRRNKSNARKCVCSFRGGGEFSAVRHIHISWRDGEGRPPLAAHTGCAVHGVRVRVFVWRVRTRACVRARATDVCRPSYARRAGVGTAAFGAGGQRGMSTSDTRGWGGGPPGNPRSVERVLGAAAAENRASPARGSVRPLGAVSAAFGFSSVFPARVAATATAGVLRTGGVSRTLSPAFAAWPLTRFPLSRPRRSHRDKVIYIYIYLTYVIVSLCSYVRGGGRSTKDLHRTSDAMFIFILFFFLLRFPPNLLLPRAPPSPSSRRFRERTILAKDAVDAGLLLLRATINIPFEAFEKFSGRFYSIIYSISRRRRCT